MSNAPTPQAPFASRHIGLSDDDRTLMLKRIGFTSMEDLIDSVVPRKIRRRTKMKLSSPLSEEQVLEELANIAKKNKVKTSLIGMGYNNCFTPPVIVRNVLENPAWYTPYTPYQPEISQGRLEALLNFQTMIIELTGMEIANSSLLDEATAAAEAMAVAKKVSKNKRKAFLVDLDTHPQTISVLRTRAMPLGIDIEVRKIEEDSDEDLKKYFGALLSYPGTSGRLSPIKRDIQRLQEIGAISVVATDLLALTILIPPGEMGADIVIGSSQRFGVPLGFGGPHAAFFAAKNHLKRSIPGRIVGVSRDKSGNPAYRLALQTREQHIRREKATSNICTAQALLAIMASFYAIWHGPEGLTKIAWHTNKMAIRFAQAMRKECHKTRHDAFFDTVVIDTGDDSERMTTAAAEAGFNIRNLGDAISVSFDETVNEITVDNLVKALVGKHLRNNKTGNTSSIPQSMLRFTSFLSHEVFQKYRTETEMLRYMRTLADRDLALDRCMIPLGSCTMKLNATAEMMAITWPEFASIHPFAPPQQTIGYKEMITKLEEMLCECTGYDAVSLQPNAGAQGELAGLLAISRYHHSRGDYNRNICLIPSSAHGTNPATAVMAGMQVVVVKCDNDGNVDVCDLKEKIKIHATNLAALMITYPSTHGVFEEAIDKICKLVHRTGGQVYVDGANLNALVGYCSLPQFGADVSHLNLHKTFCIPHGGGGPGVGPIAVAKHLQPYLPGSPIDGVGAVSATPFGSAGILPITYAYIRMMGSDGLTQATSNAILSANYIATCLNDFFPVLYKGEKGRVAHECILDVRPLQEKSGITNEDIAKRLIDFGFHAPTMSFPVPGTLMIEPTESESLEEIKRFCDAMIAIHGEIMKVITGTWPRENNPLTNAPHTAEDLLISEWQHPYTRKEAGVLDISDQKNKYWPPVNRVNNALGDRELICSCPSMEFWKDRAAE